MKKLSPALFDALFAHLSHERDYIFFDCSRIDSNNYTSLLFTKPKEKIIVTTKKEADCCFNTIEKYRKQGL